MTGFTEDLEARQAHIGSLLCVGLDAHEADLPSSSTMEEISAWYRERGERLKISGFGSFNPRDKKTRVGRNPKTGDAIQISARRVVTFKASPVLKERINSKE